MPTFGSVQKMLRSNISNIFHFINPYQSLKHKRGAA